MPNLFTYATIIIMYSNVKTDHSVLAHTPTQTTIAKTKPLLVNLVYGLLFQSDIMVLSGIIVGPCFIFRLTGLSIILSSRFISINTI